MADAKYISDFGDIALDGELFTPDAQQEMVLASNHRRACKCSKCRFDQALNAFAEAVWECGGILDRVTCSGRFEESEVRKARAKIAQALGLDYPEEQMP